MLTMSIKKSGAVELWRLWSTMSNSPPHSNTAHNLGPSGGGRSDFHLLDLPTLCPDTHVSLKKKNLIFYHEKVGCVCGGGGGVAAVLRGEGWQKNK